MVRLSKFPDPVIKREFFSITTIQLILILVSNIYVGRWYLYHLIILDDEFIKQWRSVSVDGMDDSKIEEYLDKQGIRSMQDQGMKKLNMPKRKKGAVKRKNRAPKDNEHMADILQDYSELTAEHRTIIK